MKIYKKKKKIINEVNQTSETDEKHEVKQTAETDGQHEVKQTAETDDQQTTELSFEPEDIHVVKQTSETNDQHEVNQTSETDDQHEVKQTAETNDQHESDDGMDKKQVEELSDQENVSSHDQKTRTTKSMKRKNPSDGKSFHRKKKHRINSESDNGMDKKQVEELSDQEVRGFTPFKCNVLCSFGQYTCTCFSIYKNAIIKYSSFKQS
jgi:hypothetical protein